MNLIIHKCYKDKDSAQKDMDKAAINNDVTIAYISGKKDIMEVLKELIKIEYKVS